MQHFMMSACSPPVMMETTYILPTTAPDSILPVSSPPEVAAATDDTDAMDVVTPSLSSTCPHSSCYSTSSINYFMSGSSTTTAQNDLTGSAVSSSSMSVATLPFRERYVVLDLDETLVSSKHDCQRSGCDHIDLCVPTFPGERHIFLHWRPHALAFLRCCVMSGLKLVVFSAGGRAYVMAVCRVLARLIGSSFCAIWTAENLDIATTGSFKTKNLDRLLLHLDARHEDVWVLDDAHHNYLQASDAARCLRLPPWDIDVVDRIRSFALSVGDFHNDDDRWLWWAWLRMVLDWQLSTPALWEPYLPEVFGGSEEVIQKWRRRAAQPLRSLLMWNDNTAQHDRIVVQEKGSCHNSSAAAGAFQFVTNDGDEHAVDDDDEEHNDGASSSDDDSVGGDEMKEEEDTVSDGDSVPYRKRPRPYDDDDNSVLLADKNPHVRMYRHSGGVVIYNPDEE